MQHPGIVAIHEVGEHEGLLFFSMDYIAGQNLTQLVRDGSWTATRAAACVRDIAAAIHYAHEQGVLHRDLKPSNVLMDANEKPHVTDFGLAKQFSTSVGTRSTASQIENKHDGDAVERVPTDELTLSGQLLGSSNFMPPEQAAGKPRELTPASDVYSLGAILYHCLTGRPPFVAAFQKQCGLLEALAATCPVARTSPNAAPVYDVLTSFGLTVLCDGRRFVQVQRLREDPTLNELFGLERVVSDDTLRRFAASVPEPRGRRGWRARPNACGARCRPSSS